MQISSLLVFIFISTVFAGCASSSGTSSSAFNSPMLPEGETYLEFADTQPELDYDRYSLIYPTEARRNRIEGRSIIQFVVDTEGKPHNIEVLQSSGNEMLDIAAKQSIKQARFSPGVHQGEKVNVLLTQPVDFRLGAEMPQEGN